MKRVVDSRPGAGFDSRTLVRRLGAAPWSCYRPSWWRWGIGAALLASLVVVVQPQELIAVFGRISAAWALTLIAIAGAWLGLAGLNVWLLLRRLTPLPLRTFLSEYFTSWVISVLTPGQLGDVSQIYLLRRHGVSVEKSGAAYLTDKTISLLWLLLVAAYGAGLYAPFAEVWWLLCLPLLGAAVGAASLRLLWRMEPPADSLRARVQSEVARLLDQLSEFGRYPGTLVLNVTLTVVKWILMAFLYLGAFHAFGFDLGFQAASTIPALSSLVGYIPVTVGGAGTMEWTALALFKPLGVGAAVVLSSYLYLRVALLSIALFSVVALRSSGKEQN